MRLHRLTLTAFGPFGGEHTVDFDALSEAGLFLLHGPTGAGKTSVLDAVCFALYGGVPGARQQPGGTLRSAHADPHTRTRVVLELTVAGRRLEITRAPEQLRPKARGTGLTRERAHTELRVWDGARWQGLSRSHQEIGEEIGQALGMNREQFCQVVLLPQGDFARFLRSGAEDRAKLLGRLFDTDRFAAVEEELARMRRTAQQEVAEGDEELLALTHRMRQAVGDPPELAGGPRPEAPAEPAPALPGPRRGGRSRGGSSRSGRPDEEPARLAPGTPGLADAVLGWAAQARAWARERLAGTELAAGAARARHTAALERLAESRERARAQERFAEARRRAAALEHRAPERDEAHRRLERARAADAVGPALELLTAAQTEYRRRVRARQDAYAVLPDGLAEAGTEELTARERELRQELGALRAAREEEPRAAELDAELGRLDAESRADEDLLREAADWLDGWEDIRESLRRRLDEALEATTQAERLLGELRPARARLDAARERDRLAELLRAAEQEAPAAREAANAAHESWLDLRERRLRGIAAELAAGLAAGAPCPVCGASEHPEPARAGEGHVDRAAEEAALEASRRAQERREAAERRAAALREQHAAAETAADGATGELARAVERLEAEHATAHERAGGGHAAREALTAAESEHTRRLAQQQEAERRTAARTSRRETLLNERSALLRRLERARGGAPSVAARAARLESTAERLTQAAEAAAGERAARERLTEAEARVREAARQAGFDGPEEAAEALLPEDGPEGRKALRDRLEAYRAEAAAVQAELADPELCAAAEAPAADPAAALARAEAAEQRLRAAESAHDAARASAAALDELGARATERARKLAPLRAAYEQVAALAGLTAGTSAQNERRMRLESYVLAARLEQVAAAASARLARMSAGRYTLVHSDERASGRGRSGLGLHVVDAWTGGERDTATLSGGETFFASLALALGLADVVTEEAGGTRLETLFIDEGFGSLDEQTLDEVLDVLDGLRERDRCVGIVSHVADLRRRVPVQLEVTKSRTGSALRHRTAPAPV
ncbi:AAA family ATPase [Streptomyces sp. NRRL S-1868]|uniref:AAA family ATPase n=1 Tax=Streptomyces sp. NRRL S-1868 TaxID=1463892 RepID=UPI0004C89D88|nr:SMC family ATPase [Streptomyces sp. NRRL S-1868]